MIDLQLAACRGNPAALKLLPEPTAVKGRPFDAPYNLQTDVACDACVRAAGAPIVISSFSFFFLENLTSYLYRINL
jgi:hypothetical protein